MTTPTPSAPGPTSAAHSDRVPAAKRLVTMPTARLLAASIVPCAVVAVAWIGLAAIAGWDRPRQLAGPVGAGWVGLVGAGLILAMTPWRPRAMGVWPMVWTGAGFVRLLAALGGGLLLYSRPEFGGAVVFAPVTAAYVAVMAFETREYARAMGRLQPTDVGPEPTDDPTSTHSSE